ncbi:RecB family exonuclease [Streptomyces sp. NPDC087851]|uniref:RecB family exonuclease n=1 Tax=Streptomyces sp. NPDC087851 TaxID=3365810 RepID=UPI003805DE6D
MNSPGKPGEIRQVKHMSHSSRETLERCAKSWFLKYMAKAPQRPALWSAGGTAVHEVTEWYDLMALNGKADIATSALGGTWETLFGHQLAKIREKEPNENAWRKSAGDSVAAWNALGPELVQAYIDWRERSPWEIWTTPDGEPAIELDVGGMLPGCPVEIKGYVDRIFHDPMFDRLVILDLKSGKRAPKSGDQFGAYGALVAQKYGVTAHLGVPFMNRKGTVGRAYELAEYTPAAVGAVFGAAWKKVQAGSFPATGFPGECFICDVQAACAAQNGPLAHIYDPASPGHPSNDPP